MLTAKIGKLLTKVHPWDASELIFSIFPTNHSVDLKTKSQPKKHNIVYAFLSVLVSAVNVWKFW